MTLDLFGVIVLNLVIFDDNQFNRAYATVITASNKWFRHRIANGNITSVLDYTHEVSVVEAECQNLETITETWKLFDTCYMRNNELIFFAKFRNDADEFLFKCANPLFKVSNLFEL